MKNKKENEVEWTFHSPKIQQNFKELLEIHLYREYKRRCIEKINIKVNNENVKVKFNNTHKFKFIQDIINEKLYFKTKEIIAGYEY